MQYEIVYSNDTTMYKSLERVERKVKQLCVQGWKPQGGISIAYKDDLFYACQAMVKE